MKQIIINCEELQTRAAVVQDGILEDFFFERAKRDHLVGSIYKGKIKNMEASLQAAFVDIGMGKNVFLHYWDMLPASEDILEESEDEHSEIDDALEMASPKDLAFVPRHGHGKTNRNTNDNSSIDAETQQKLLPLVPNDRVVQRIPLPPPAAGEGKNPENGAVQNKNNENKKKNLNGRNANQGSRSKNLSGVAENGVVPLVPNGGKSAQDGKWGAGKLFPLQPEKEKAAAAPMPSQAPQQGTGFFRRFCNLLLGKKTEQGPVDTTAGRELNNIEPSANSQQGQGNNRKKGGNNQKGNGAAKVVSLEASGSASVPQGTAKVSKTPKLLKLPKPAKPAKPQKTAGPNIEDIPKLFSVGQEILVQVTKGPIGEKGARVTTNLSIPGRYLVLLPTTPQIGVSRRVEDHEERKRLKQMLKSLKLPEGMGLIGRTAGKGLSQENFQRDLDMLLDSWNKGEKLSKDKPAPVCVYQEPSLVERLLRDCLTDDIDEIITDSEDTYKLASDILKRYDTQSKIKVKLHTNPTPIFIQYHISKQIETISERKVPLPSGGYLCIDETEALIAIDVNSGKNHTGKDQPETIKTTNMEAVKEIARQLRLRNIGGLVILDLIDMKTKKDQQEVYKAFKDYLANDRARIKTFPISGLGLLEMSRQRECESLEAQMYDDCPYCHGRGLIKNAVCISAEIQRRLHELLGKAKNIVDLEIRVHPKVLERLKTDRKIMEAMAAEYNRRLTFKPDAEMHIEEFVMTDLQTGKQV